MNPTQPCPFCGKPAVLKTDGDHHGEFFELGCHDQNCPAHWTFYTEEIANLPSAIASWNTRAESPDLTAERQKREAVEKELESVRTVGVEERGRLIKDRDTLKARVAELERELARINVSWTETVKTGQQINEENKRLSKQNEGFRMALSGTEGLLATLRQELEAAKKERDEWHAELLVSRGETESAERQLADSTARVEALTEVVKEAPHAGHCCAVGPYPWTMPIQEDRCDCWKSRALTASAPTDAGQADAGAESAKAATGWLPIETAPKDALLVIWRKSWNSPLIAELTVRGWRPLGGATLVYPPTHWMPLPATPPETTEVRAVEPQCLKHLDDEHYCALPPGHSGPCGVIKGLYRNTPQPGAENATGEQKISACAQHGDHHDPSCARCAYLANHYRTGLVNLRSEKPQPQGEQAESAPTIEEHFGQPAGSFAKFVDGQQIAPGHNPDKLTNEQVGEGWVLLTPEEVEKRQHRDHEANDVECWNDGVWEGGYFGAVPSFTYRRRVTPSEGKGAK